MSAATCGMASRAVDAVVVASKRRRVILRVVFVVLPFFYSIKGGGVVFLFFSPGGGGAVSGVVAPKLWLVSALLSAEIGSQRQVSAGQIRAKKCQRCLP